MAVGCVVPHKTHSRRACSSKRADNLKKFCCLGEVPPANNMFARHIAFPLEHDGNQSLRGTRIGTEGPCTCPEVKLGKNLMLHSLILRMSMIFKLGKEKIPFMGPPTVAALNWPGIRIGGVSFWVWLTWDGLDVRWDGVGLGFSHLPGKSCLKVAQSHAMVPPPRSM